jgi:hypothetical protein
LKKIRGQFVILERKKIGEWICNFKKIIGVNLKILKYMEGKNFKFLNFGSHLKFFKFQMASNFLN